MKEKTFAVNWVWESFRPCRLVLGDEIENFRLLEQLAQLLMNLLLPLDSHPHQQNQ